MDAHELIWRSLNKLAKRYGAQVRAARQSLTPESVHAFRVASRRLIAALDLVDAALDNKTAGSVGGSLKKGLKKLGPLRDIHVHQTLVSTYRKVSTDVDRLLSASRREEKALVRENRRDLRKIERTDIEKCLQRLEKKLEKRERQIGRARFIASFTRRIRHTTSGLARLQTRLDPLHPKTFHQLRLQLRELRYQLEFLQSALDIESRRLARLKTYQGQLGGIQDLSVAINELQEMKGTDPEVVQILTQRRDRKMKQFLTKARTLPDFLRGFEIHSSLRMAKR